jgi:hypothetical protein
MVEWVAALSNFLAIGVAIWLALVPWKRDAQSEKKKATMLAWLLTEELSLTISACNTLRNYTDEQISAASVANSEAERLIQEAVRNAGLPQSKAHIFDLSLLPGDAGRRIASVAGLVTPMRGYVDRAMKAREIAHTIWGQLSVAQQLAAEAANEGVPKALLKMAKS